MSHPLKLTETATGAHVLTATKGPRNLDNRATISAWHAHLALDADQRTKYPEYRALAEKLRIVHDTNTTTDKEPTMPKETNPRRGGR